MATNLTRTLAYIASALLAATAHAQVVINEIHYDPADVTKQEEFIELYNAGAAEVNVAGWRIEDAVDFVFPAGTTIAPGGYLVIAQNLAHFQARYGFAPLGPWTGVLKNDGERITIKDTTAAIVDEVNYDAGFPWPTAARGAGQSAELIHPSLDNTLGGSWRASVATPDTLLIPRASSGWRYRETRSDPPATWKQLLFDDTGAEWANCTMPAGFALSAQFSPAVTWGTTVGYGGNTADKTRTYYFRKKFNIASLPAVSAISFRIRRDDGAILWLNDDANPVISVDAAAAWNPVGPPYTYASLAPNALTSTPGLADYATFSIPTSKLVVGDNIVAIELHQSSIGSSDLLIDAEIAIPGASGGSPGAQNTVFSATAPPAIRQVEHTPQQPAAATDVLITAKITDPDGVASATLSYQLVSPGSYIRKTDAAYATTWTNVPMNDAGTDGDVLAGDSIFTCTMPAALQTNRRLVRYRVSASDGTTSITVPYADDEQPNFAYFVYNGAPAWNGALRPTTYNGFPATAVQTFPSTLLNSIQPYHLIANAQNVIDCQYTSAFNDVEFPGTLVFDGVVYDHIQFKNRGIGSTYVSGKNKWAFLFNRARDFEPRDNWGRKYDSTWNSFGMDANAGPWAAVHRGSAGVEEALSYRIFELAGVPALRTHYVHFRVVDDAAEAGATQYDGDLWGLYLALEPMESNFLDERNLPDGNIYSIETNNGDKKHQGPTQDTGQTDWTTFRNAVALAGQGEDFYRANEDLTNLYTFMGLSRLIGNVDVRPGDNYRYYHRPTDNKWLIMPYDLDMQFIAAHHWGGGMDGGVVVAGAPNTIRSISRYPATIGVEFRNRCRELLSLMASDASTNGGQIGQLVDEYAQMVNPTGVALTWADLDAAMWNLHPRTAGSGANTGQSSHKGNFWRANYNDGTRGGLGGTIQTSTWIRQLSDPDSDQFSDHEGLMQWFVNFSTNTWPGGTWLRKAVTTGGGADPSVDRQKGFGYKYLEWESLYGGWVNATAEPTSPADLSFPNTPTITYAGPAGYPVNALDFTSSAFSASASGGTTFSAMQWRIGEIYAPGIPGYIAGDKRRYEIEQVWTSAELPAFTATARVPLAYVEPGKTYRARVRHKDANGRWSLWSAPVPFVASAPDVSIYTSSLVVSEVNYNPLPVTPAEFTAGFSSDDFEWIEVKNVSALPVDMTDVRFTKGADFDFPNSWTIPPGGFALIVQNLAAFQMRYGNGFNPIIAGAFPNDHLSNTGEQIKLSYGVGTPIVDFTYTDTAPWPEAADGSGKTLSLRNVNTHPNPTVPANWKASYATGGTPGADDVLTFDTWNDSYAGVVDLLGDNDGDGIVNLLEYGLGANPLTSDLSPLPARGVQTYTVSGTPGDYLTLTVIRRTDASDLSFTVEFATSLTGAWNAGVLVGSTPGAGDSVIETWRSPSPLSTELKQFGRLRVVAP